MRRGGGGGARLFNVDEYGVGWQSSSLVVKADRFWQQLGWRWRLDRAEAAEPIDEVVILGQTLHKVFIFQEVKHIRRRHKARFLACRSLRTIVAGALSAHLTACLVRRLTVDDSITPFGLL